MVLSGTGQGSSENHFAGLVLSNGVIHGSYHTELQLELNEIHEKITSQRGTFTELWCPGRGSARAAQAGRSPHFPPAKVLMTYRHTRTWVTPRAGWPRPSDLGVPLGEMHAPMASLSQLRESELGICECSRYVDVFSSFFLFRFVFSFHSFEGHSENPFGKMMWI